MENFLLDTGRAPDNQEPAVTWLATILGRCFLYSSCLQNQTKIAEIFTA
jgi:hypothetical protein